MQTLEDQPRGSNKAIITSTNEPDKDKGMSRTVSFLSLYKFSSSFEKFLLFVAALVATATGVAYPGL